MQTPLPWQKPPFWQGHRRGHRDLRQAFSQLWKILKSVSYYLCLQQHYSRVRVCYFQSTAKTNSLIYCMKVYCFQSKAETNSPIHGGLLLSVHNSLIHEWLLLSISCWNKPINTWRSITFNSLLKIMTNAIFKGTVFCPNGTLLMFLSRSNQMHPSSKFFWENALD